MHMHSLETMNTLQALISAKDIPNLAFFLHAERNIGRGDFIYTMDALVDYTTSSATDYPCKTDFLVELFYHPDTKDLLRTFEFEKVIYLAVHQNNFSLFESMVNVIDPANPDHHPQLFTLHCMFVETCRYDRVPWARFMLDHETVKNYINPLGRNNYPLETALLQEMHGIRSVSSVIRDVLLPLYPDDNLDDVKALQTANPAFLEKYFDAFSIAKKDWIVLLREGIGWNKSWPQEMPTIDAWATKQVLMRATEAQLDISPSKKPRVF